MPDAPSRHDQLPPSPALPSLTDLRLSNPLPGCSFSGDPFELANGAQLVATRFLVQQNEPLISLLRHSIAFACLVPLLRNTSHWPIRRDCVTILGLGAIGAGACPWLLTLSMQYTTASRGALRAMPLLGVLVGLSERLLAAQPFFNFGDGIVLFTTVLLALFNVYAGKTLLRYRATTIAPMQR